MNDRLEASALIDAVLAGLKDWRGVVPARMRALVHEAVPDVAETVKWKEPTNPSGVPVWDHAGIICTGEVYKTYVKFAFTHGAALADPSSVFNAGFCGGTRRAIDIREGDSVDAVAFIALVRKAVVLNAAK